MQQGRTWLFAAVAGLVVLVSGFMIGKRSGGPIIRPGFDVTTGADADVVGPVSSGATSSGGLRSGLRGNAPLNQEGQAPRMLSQANTDVREVRNYPEQPPVIPHTIEAYQVDANVNQCLSCHARTRVGESQAPMVSITHFMDRDGQFLASVSPRRYFCNQCHVPQHAVKVPVPNKFIDVDSLIAGPPAGAKP
jgi:nitrate reductase (cytochrome), electron transfer subunit